MFKESDYLPSEGFANSGIALTCPLCGEEGLYVYRPVGLSYSLLSCSLCGFCGNVVHIHARLTRQTYREALMEYEDADDSLKKAENFGSHLAELQADLRQGQRALRENMPMAQALLDQCEVDVNLQFSAPLMQRLLLLDADLRSRLIAPLNLPKHPLLCVPMYLCPGIPIRFYLFWEKTLIPRKNKHAEEFLPPHMTQNRRGGISTGGLAHFTSDTKEQLVVFDPRQAVELAHLRHRATGGGNVAITLMHPSGSLRDWSCYPREKLFVFAGEEMPRATRSLSMAEGVEYLSLEYEQLKELVSRAGKLSDNLKGPALGKEQFLVHMAETQPEKLESMEEWDFSPKSLERVWNELSSPAARQAFSKQWSLDRKPLAAVRSPHSEACLREKEGGIYSRGEKKNAHNIDFRIDLQLVSNTRLYRQGHLRYQGMDVPYEIDSTLSKENMRHRIRKALVDAGISDCPRLPTKWATWMDLCEIFSRPMNLKGLDSPGYDPDIGMVLPGRVLTPGGLKKSNRIARVDIPEAPRLPSWEKAFTADLWDPSPELTTIWGVALGLAYSTLSALFDVPLRSLVAVESAPGSEGVQLLERGAAALNIKGPLTGYPYLSSFPSSARSICCTDLLSACLASIKYDHHFLIFSQKLEVENAEKIDLAIRIILDSVCRELYLSEVADLRSCDCICHPLSQIVARYAREVLRKEPTALLNGADRVLCKDLLDSPVRALNKAERVLLFLDVCDLLFKEKIVSRGEDGVALNIALAWKLAGENRKINLKAEELRDALFQLSYAKGGSLQEVYVKRETWDKLTAEVRKHYASRLEESAPVDNKV